MRFATVALGGALLLPGMTAHAAAVHVANEGTTLWKVSKYYGIPLDQVLRANPNVDPLNIYPGLRLNVPAVAGTSAAAAALKAADAAPASAASMVTTSTGQSLAFSKVLSVKATAYSDSAEENGWGPVDYFGNRLTLGTIAVDPKVIPFGTKLYVTGYDFAGLPVGGMVGTALDAGSAIKGNRIDIFVPGSRGKVAKFGIQNVKVYVLK